MALAAIIGYFLGSFPSAQIVGKIFRVDPLRSGDGNPGWWNMRTLVGEKAAIAVLVLDIAKGLAAGLAGNALWGPWWTVYIAVFFAMVGHSFPVFAGFRGGRALLTFTGGMLAIAPVPTLIAIAAGSVIAVGFRSIGKGAIAAVVIGPFVQSAMEPRAHVAVTGILMTFIGLRFLSLSLRRRFDPSMSGPASPSPA